ncbi:MAG: hypothetical protein M1823_001697 [Watsoniomyces obsoletus]|nr:MAG: hypothetical protein M1823_001697 [Watsoniomyces obsoletus]
MSSEHTTVASAVVLPDESPSSPGLKRRPSSPSESEQKRRRLSGGSPEPGKDEDKTATGDPPHKRRFGKDEERKRGQRLFGALLGTLSQNSPTTAQKRRADIERKQQSKLKQQADEYDAKQKEDLEKLLAVRKQEQKKFDEQSMRIRHSNMLATAHFLRTKTEPRLYYKPWQLSPSEKSQIDAQIEDAEATIEEETRRFEEKRQQEKVEEESKQPDVEMSEEPHVNPVVSEERHQSLDGSAETPKRDSNGEPQLPQQETSQEMVGETARETDQARILDSTMHDHSEVQEQKERPGTSNKQGEATDHDGGEVMVEADEDTVIY